MCCRQDDVLVTNSAFGHSENRFFLAIIVMGCSDFRSYYVATNDFTLLSMH